MAREYRPPKVFLNYLEVDDILAVSKVEDPLDIFDLGVNEEL